MHLRQSKRSLLLILGAAAATLIAALGLPAPHAAHAQQLEWAARFDGPSGGSDSPYQQGKMLATDTQGNVYVTGQSQSATNGADIVTLKYNPQGQQMWVARYDGPGHSTDIPLGIAVDNAGNVFVTGQAYSGATTGSDLITLKYNSAGTQEWAQRYSATSTAATEAAFAIAVDTTGNVYITGTAYNEAINAYDYITLKYNSAGARRWVARYSGPNGQTSIAYALAIDPQNNVYVTGTSYAAGHNNDYATVKYNAAGVQQWAARYNDPDNGTDAAYAIAVDKNGGVFVTGMSSNATNTDYETIKYDSNGTQLWAQRYDGPAADADAASAIALDDAGNAYVTGTSFGGISGTGGTSDDIVTIKYDGGSGGQIWNARYDGGVANTTYSHNDNGKSIALDAQGNVYVTGASYNEQASPSQDYVTIKYNHNGQAQWTQRYEGTDHSTDFASAVTVDGQGNVYVTGSSYGAGSNNDIVTLKYSAQSLWTAQDIATGADNKTRILWNRTDGAIAVWVVNADGTIGPAKQYGPYAGLTARALAVGADLKPRVLWDSGPGKAVVWTLKADVSAIETGYTFTAAGYYPWEIAVGATDGKTRISWYDSTDKVAIWTLTAGSVTQSVLFNAPAGYQDQAIAVGADNRIRLAWNNFGTQKAALWTLNASTLSTIDTAYTFGPLSPVSTFWYVSDLAVGADNKPRLLWNNTNNQAALWQVASGTSTVESGLLLGPLPLVGWVPTHLSFSGGAGSDGNVRLLWNASSGSALLYTVNPTTGAIVTSSGFGPL